MSVPDELAAICAERWFGGRTRPVRDLRERDAFELGGGGPAIRIVDVRFDDAGPDETYAVAVPAAGPAVGAALYRAVDSSARIESRRGGRVVAWRGPAFRDVPPGSAEMLRVEQSNTSFRFDRSLVLKWFRRLAGGGPNPELEVVRFLCERTSFRDLAALAGAVEYVGPDGFATTLAVLLEFVPSVSDGWTYFLGRMGTRGLLDDLTTLGRTTAELHGALASEAAEEDPAFAPEPFESAHVAAIAGAARRSLARAPVPDDLSPLVDRSLEWLGRAGAPPGSRRTRVHGDYHLGQVLRRTEPPGGFAVIDFEGEPARSIEERRAKRSPLKDLAGMLRSIDYAARVGRAPRGFADEARAAFLRGYGGAHLELVPLFELEKALYEVRYEANHRPDWLAIPVEGIREIVGRFAWPAFLRGQELRG